MKTMKKYLMTLVLMIAAMTMVTGLTSTTAFAKTKYSRYVVQYCKVKCKVNIDSYKTIHYNLTLSGKWKNVPKSGITLKQKDIKLPKKHTIDDEISNSSFIALRLYDTKEKKGIDIKLKGVAEKSYKITTGKSSTGTSYSKTNRGISGETELSGRWDKRRGIRVYEWADATYLPKISRKCSKNVVTDTVTFKYKGKKYSVKIKNVQPSKNSRYAKACIDHMKMRAIDSAYGEDAHRYDADALFEAEKKASYRKITIEQYEEIMKNLAEEGKKENEKYQEEMFGDRLKK
jgi:hypothetical protein